MSFPTVKTLLTPAVVRTPAMFAHVRDATTVTITSARQPGSREAASPASVQSPETSAQQGQGPEASDQEGPRSFHRNATHAAAPAMLTLPLVSC